MAAAVFAFLSTDVGQHASLDQQMQMLESFGGSICRRGLRPDGGSMPPTRALFRGRRRSLVAIPLICAVVAGIMLAIFNGVLGGDAAFKQVFAVVAHSQRPDGAAHAVLRLPLNYARETMSSPTNLAVFAAVPRRQRRFGAAARLRSICFVVWWIVNLAIGSACCTSDERARSRRRCSSCTSRSRLTIAAV